MRSISGATRDDLVRHTGVHSEKITVIHHGLSERFQPVASPDLLAAAQARYGISGPYFFYIGTIQPRKNLTRLIEAFAMLEARDLGLEASEEVARSNPQPLASSLRLVIAGKRGWLTEAIERRAAELGVADRVLFTGYVPDGDVPALLSGALGFVFPSLYEGFGMPVLEAMACGAPVLASNSSSLPEVAGDAALLVDPTNTAAIAAAMARLAQEPALRAELRARGLARAAQFTWERCAEQTLAVLRGAY